MLSLVLLLAVDALLHNLNAFAAYFIDFGCDWDVFVS